MSNPHHLLTLLLPRPSSRCIVWRVMTVISEITSDIISGYIQCGSVCGMMRILPLASTVLLYYKTFKTEFKELYQMQTLDSLLCVLRR